AVGMPESPAVLIFWPEPWLSRNRHHSTSRLRSWSLEPSVLLSVRQVGRCQAALRSTRATIHRPAMDRCGNAPEAFRHTSRSRQNSRQLLQRSQFSFALEPKEIFSSVELVLSE